MARQASDAGAILKARCEVRAVERSGRIHFADGCSQQHDCVLNVCGPWAEQLLVRSGIASLYRLDLVRGSHLVLDRPCLQAYLLEVRGEARIAFVLSWHGRTFVGTTAHATAIVEEGAQIGASTRIWHWTHVCGGACIGADCSLGQNVFVGNKVRIGDNVKIQNNVSVYDNVTLEDAVFCGPSMVFTNVHNARSHVSPKHEYRNTLVRCGATRRAQLLVKAGSGDA